MVILGDTELILYSIGQGKLIIPRKLLVCITASNERSFRVYSVRIPVVVCFDSLYSPKYKTFQRSEFQIGITVQTGIVVIARLYGVQIVSAPLLVFIILVAFCSPMPRTVSLFDKLVRRNPWNGRQCRTHRVCKRISATTLEGSTVSPCCLIGQLHIGTQLQPIVSLDVDI